MKNLTQYFENKLIQEKNLLKYGFVKKESSYFYKQNIYKDQFQVIIESSKKRKISKVIDLLTKEEYILVDLEDRTGNFAGKIKEEYENILRDMIEKCTLVHVFKSKQATEIIRYVQEKYQGNLEYLWSKFPKTAVWRCKENKKWYGLLFLVSKRNLGISFDEEIEIIDLRYPKEKIKDRVDQQKIFEGYHMNKKNWITIPLDERVATKEICKLLDIRFQIAQKK